MVWNEVDDIWCEGLSGEAGYNAGEEDSRLGDCWADKI